MPHPSVKAVLFDMDGLMIDSENIYTAVSNEILAPYGKKMTWEVKAGIMGRPGLDAARFLIEAMELPLSPDELLEMMDKRTVEAFKHVQPLPGIVRLVNHLEKHRIPMAIATGSKQKNFDVKSAHLQHLFKPFGDRVLCGDDPRLEGKGKPDPAIFLLAAKLFLDITNPEDRAQVLVFEDGAPGVRAARAAGMEVVWVPDPELVKQLGDDHGLDPTHQHESIAHFDPSQWGLPPYDEE